MTNGLMKFSGILEKERKKNENANAAPGYMIHPLYVELQRKSPMGMMRDWNITEIDMETETIGKHEFYQKYLSKSLPLVMRKDAKEWPLFKEIHSALRKGEEDLEDYLQNMFSADRGTKKIGHLFTYFRIFKNATEETF